MEDSSHDSEPSSSTPGRFQLRPSALDKHAASLFKGNVSELTDVLKQTPYTIMCCGLA